MLHECSRKFAHQKMGTEIFHRFLISQLILTQIGLLILQLLEGCDNNRMAFESAPEDSKYNSLFRDFGVHFLRLE